MNKVQAMLDGMSAEWQKERAATQMTLGDIIKTLTAMPPETEIKGLGDFNSYRGYYIDLAFEPTTELRPAGEIIAQCKAAMGVVFEGYKGGDFVMGALTPMWVADYGDCGVKLISISNGGVVETAQDDE